VWWVRLEGKGRALCSEVQARLLRPTFVSVFCETYKRGRFSLARCGAAPLGRTDRFSILRQLGRGSKGKFERADPPLSNYRSVEATLSSASPLPTHPHPTHTTLHRLYTTLPHQPKMGFEKEVLQAGTGPAPTKGSTVTVHCEGFGKNGDLNVPFWSTKGKYLWPGKWARKRDRR